MRHGSIVFLGALLTLLGCGSEGGDADAGTSSDAGPADAGTVADAGTGVDSGTVTDAGSVADAGTLADAGSVADAGISIDAGPPDAGPRDAGSVRDAGPRDAGARDAGMAAGCVGAGGTCVPVVPGSCSTGIVGRGDWYSCGGGLGVMCCLPLRTAPVCRVVAATGEGWYAVDGTLICNAACDGAVLDCRNAGTRSEGWYTDTLAAACVSPPVDGLVQWTDCAP